jgi:hypothetical protein
VCCDERSHLCVGDWPTPAVFHRLRDRLDRPARHCPTSTYAERSSLEASIADTSRGANA